MGQQSPHSDQETLNQLPFPVWHCAGILFFGSSERFFQGDHGSILFQYIFFFSHPQMETEWKDTFSKENGRGEF